MQFVQFVFCQKSLWNISLYIVIVTGEFGLNSLNGGVYPSVVQICDLTSYNNGKSSLKGNFRRRYGSCYFLLLSCHYGFPEMN